MPTLIDRLNRLRTQSLPLAVTAMRVTLGLIMTVHGWEKLADVDAWARNLASLDVPAPEINAWLSIAGEFLGGLGLMVGALTPIAALGTASTMVVAILSVHIDHGLLARNNGFEYPLTLLAVSLFFVAYGAGPISVDAWLARRGDRT